MHLDEHLNDGPGLMIYIAMAGTSPRLPLLSIAYRRFGHPGFRDADL